jgi:hypothetical protein
MSEITVLSKEVAGVKFEVHLKAVEKLDSYGRLAFLWKAPGHAENTANDEGWYYGDYNSAKGYVETYSLKVGKQKITGVSLPAEARAKADGLLARLAAERESRIAALRPVGFTFVYGCDTADTYSLSWPEGCNYDESSEAEKRLGATDLIRTHVRSNDLKRLAEETGAVPVPAGAMSYGGWTFDAAGLGRIVALAEGRAAEGQAREDGRRQAAETKRAAAFAEAKRTGKPVVLAHWTADCDDPREECDLDDVTEYALPDWTTRTERHHTW